jgi:hypothetical protein
VNRPNGIFKRSADVPLCAHRLNEGVSKADLLEAAWHLASLCNEAGSCDDVASTLERLIEELNTIRANRGERPMGGGALVRARAALAGGGR